MQKKESTDIFNFLYKPAWYSKTSYFFKNIWKCVAACFLQYYGIEALSSKL